MFAVIKMELSGNTVYGPVLKTTQLSAHAQNHASPERCRKSFTMIFLGDHDIPLTGSNFGNMTVFRAIFSHIFTAHMTIRCLVIAADTLRDRVTFDLLTLVSGHTWRVTWSTPPPSLKILRLSVLELRVLTSPIGYH